MIEKRIINGKEYWVNVIINEDGSRMENIIGDRNEPMKDAAEAYANAMAKEFDRQRKIQQEDQDYYETQLRLKRSEQERKMQEELDYQNAMLEEQKRINSYNEYEDDIRSNPNFDMYLTEEEKYALKYYLKYIDGYCTKKDLKSFVKGCFWKDVKEDFIKECDEKHKKDLQEIDENIKRKEEEKIKAKQESEKRWEEIARKDRNTKIAIGIAITIVAIVLILCMWGCSMDTTTL